MEVLFPYDYIPEMCDSLDVCEFEFSYSDLVVGRVWWRWFCDTISYPADWKVQTEQTAIVFSDAQQMNTLTIAVAPNPGGVASASTVLAASLTTAEQAAKATNVQPVSGLPATSTVGGEAWVQSGVTGTVTDSGVAVSIELVGLAVNHPANSPSTKTFEIYYGGPALTFQQESAAVFQPMLQSFKFTA